MNDAFRKLHQLDHMFAAVSRIPDQLPTARIDHEVHQFERDLSDPHRTRIIYLNDIADTVSLQDRQPNRAVGWHISNPRRGHRSPAAS